MSSTALALALLGVLGAQAQLRTVPARAPSLAPTLSAPLAPTPLTPLLTPSPAVTLPLAAPQPTLDAPTLPRAAAAALPAHAAAVQASPALQAPPALHSLPVPRAGEGGVRATAQESLTQTVQTLSRGGQAAQAPALASLFAGERPRAVNAAAVLGNEGAGRAPLGLLPAAKPDGTRAAPAPAAQPHLDADVDRWLARLEGGSWARRLVMRLGFPTGWPTLARSLGLAMELRPWRKVTQAWLDSGNPPETAATLARRLAPALEEEAVLAAERLAGRALSAAERSDVVGRTRLVSVGLHKTLVNEFGVMGSYPDGVARPDGSIELTYKPTPSLPDAESYYRTLFAHEYTHRLQFEGDVTKRFGIEAPPVAVELLRGIELVGLDALKAGRIPLITENVLQGFAAGRAWAAGARTGDAGFHFKGALAGAAWELAQRTGRPADAWEFARRVSSQKRVEDPAKVYADIAAR